MFYSVAEIFSNITNNRIFGGVCLALIVAIGAWMVNRYSLGFWQWWRWYLTRIQYVFRRELRRKKPLVVCLDEYVYILEKLRDAIVKKCAHVHHGNGKVPEILIHVFTKQLPSDWPLWGSSINPNDDPQNGLERYIRDFYRFLNQGKDNGYSVSVRRVIIIDNGRSDIGKEKCERICHDTNDATFQEHWKTYLKYLHNEDVSGAQVYWTERPWPGWISDAVFYGIHVPDKPTRWLWGVTTSYDAGEDVVLLRLHNKLNRELDGRWWSGRLVLPNGVMTLEDLAIRAYDYPNSIKLPTPEPWEPWKG